MHIPDGFLDAKTWISTTALGAFAVGTALNKSKINIQPKQVPQIALMGAFIFAAQMINFPIMGATSGHFLGGALAATLFGPWIAIILMTSVLIVQAVIFQDGGITVLGANILCSGVVGSFVGYAFYKLSHQFASHRVLQSVFIFLGGWFSIVIASLCIAFLLAFSGNLELELAVKTMTAWHGVIGIGEGLVTTVLFTYLKKRNWVFKEEQKNIEHNTGDVA